MPRITLTDYQSFQDTTRIEALRLKFTLPENFVKGTARAIPVLMFRVDATADCECWVHVNDAADAPTSSNSDVTLNVQGGLGHRTVHELLHGAQFKPGRENQILIHKAPGNGGAHFYVSDIVLSYQLYIDI